MSSIAVSGRKAFAALLRTIADQIEEGSIIHPPSIQSAPHLGPFVVRVVGVDYDLALRTPGVTPDPADDEETPTTEPGKRKR